MCSGDKAEDMSLHESENFNSSEKINDNQCVMETLLKEVDELRTTKSIFVSHLQDERRKLEIEKELYYEMEKRQQIMKWRWMKHCDVLLQVAAEKEEMLEEVVDDMETLKATVETLKEKAQDMDPDGLKKVGERLKDDVLQQVKKLLKKNSTKTRQCFENEIKELELQLRVCKSQEVRSLHVINVLMNDRKDRQVDLRISCSLEKVQKKVRDSKAREVSPTNMINSLAKEREDIKKNILEEKERMVLELKTERKNMKNKRNKERFKLLKRDREIIEELMLEKLSHLTTFQPDQILKQIRRKDSMKGTLQMKKVQERIELQSRVNEYSEELEALVKGRDELRRTFQADIYNLLLQTEEEQRRLETEKKRCDDMEKMNEILIASWKRHCDELVQMIVFKEKLLEDVMSDVDALKETVKELKQKAWDHEMMKELQEVHKRLKNFGPKWFKKLHKKKNTKMRQDFEKEIKELKLQLRDYKSQDVHTTELIEILLKERMQTMIDIEFCHLMWKDMKDFPKQINSREALATKLINSLVNEMDEIKNKFLEEKKRMAMKINKERKNMEKETNNERFKLLKREREVIEKFIMEKRMR